MRHTHLLTILYANQQSINKVPKIWGQLNEKGNGSSPDPYLVAHLKKKGSGSRDYPDKALMCCSIESWKTCRLDRVLAGFPRLSSTSMWAFTILYVWPKRSLSRGMEWV